MYSVECFICGAKYKIDSLEAPTICPNCGAVEFTKIMSSEYQEPLYKDKL